MSIDLYSIPASPPCRAVLMVAKELGVELNIKSLDLAKGEHKTPEFLKINPQHTIPTLVDNENNGLVLAESRAIMSYLINKKSPGHKLYPEDPAERAQIDRVLYFEAGTLYPAQAAALYGVFRGGEVDEEKVKVYNEKLDVLNSMLDGKKYLAGHNHRTIADLSMITTLTAAQCFPGVDLSKYANIDSWLKNLRSELPYDKELIQDGIDALKGFIAALKAAK